MIPAFPEVQRGLDAIARLCRTAVAQHHGYRASNERTDDISLYWCEGFRQPTAASVGRLSERRGPFGPSVGHNLSPLVVSVVSGKRVTYANGPGTLLALGSIFFAMQDGDVVWGAGFAKRDHVRYAVAARRVTYRIERFAP
jgi:hypothetical protein